MNNAATFKIGYGLYVLTAKKDGKDNGCIINTLMQVTSTPVLTGIITVNKANYTHDIIKETKEFNASVLTTEVPFSIFERFGFQSGRDIDKFSDFHDIKRSENGIIYLPSYSNAYLSFEVTNSIDFGTHTMFTANITGGDVLNDAMSLTYDYYHKNIKPKPQNTKKRGFRCEICGYVYEGESLPDDYICPICKHGASDFTEV